MIESKYLAYLLITCNDDKITDVISYLKEIDEVTDIQGTCGAYDIITKIESNSFDQLRQVTINKIRKIDNIRSAITLRCAQTS